MELSSIEKLIVTVNDQDVEFLPYPSSKSESVLEEFKIDLTDFKMYGNLMLSLADVFKCFNNIVSHNVIPLKINRNDRIEIMKWTAQDVGFLCILYRMLNSNCETFSRFKEYINLFNINPTPNVFIKANVSEIFFEKLSNNERIDIPVIKELALERNKKISEIIAKLFDHLQGKFKKDSILNSIVLALNIATINYEFIDDYFDELRLKHQP